MFIEGDARHQMTLEEALIFREDQPAVFLQINDVIDPLAAVDSWPAAIVDWRFFGGFSDEGGPRCSW